MTTNPRTSEKQPSTSAYNVALCRALAAHDPRAEMRGADNLAEIFLPEDSRQSLKNMAIRPAILQKLAAVSPGGYEYFFARTHYFDDAVEQALQDNIPQIVLLGAGYDTRAYRFQEMIHNTQLFELDSAATQHHKRSLLEAAGVTVPSQVHFLSVDFTRNDLGEVLAGAGYDRAKRTLFLWEGVTYYLPPASVDEVLAFIRQNSPVGSLLYFDYMVRNLDGYGSKQARDAMQVMYTQEPLQFDLDRQQIVTFMAARGFTFVEQITSIEMEKRYLTLNNGELAGKALDLFCLVKAQV